MLREKVGHLQCDGRLFRGWIWVFGTTLLLRRRLWVEAVTPAAVTKVLCGKGAEVEGAAV